MMAKIIQIETAYSPTHGADVLYVLTDKGTIHRGRYQQEGQRVVRFIWDRIDTKEVKE